MCVNILYVAHKTALNVIWCCILKYSCNRLLSQFIKPLESFRTENPCVHTKILRDFIYLNFIVTYVLRMNVQ